MDTIHEKGINTVKELEFLANDIDVKLMTHNFETR
jgi:hypothetical protein